MTVRPPRPDPDGRCADCRSQNTRIKGFKEHYEWFCIDCGNTWEPR